MSKKQIKKLRDAFKDTEKWAIVHVDYIGAKDLHEKKLLIKLNAYVLQDYEIIDYSSESDFGGPGVYIVLPKEFAEPSNINDYWDTPFAKIISNCFFHIGGNSIKYLRNNEDPNFNHHFISRLKIGATNKNDRYSETLPLKDMLKKFGLRDPNLF